MVPSAVGLAQLPPEVLLRILHALKHVSPETVVACMWSCSALHRTANMLSEDDWRHAAMVLLDLPRLCGIDWDALPPRVNAKRVMAYCVQSTHACGLRSRLDRDEPQSTCVGTCRRSEPLYTVRGE